MQKNQRNGYSIIIHYTPEDVAAQIKQTIDYIEGLDMSDLDDDERAAMQRYLEVNKKYLQ